MWHLKEPPNKSHQYSCSTRSSSDPLGECAMNCRAYAKALHYMQGTGVPQETQHQDHGVAHRVRGVVCCVWGGRGE